MSATVAPGPNADQIRHWNEVAGAKWVALQDVLDVQIGPLGLRAMARAAVAPGERVLDVGCGCGASSLELARRVGPTGRVTGIDVSEPMLARAAERARAAGLDIEFVAGDAQTHPFPAGSRDLVFSRFGVMFFADPTTAFRNLHRALAPGGRLAFVCWQALDRNPWAARPLAAAARHLPLPSPPGPGAPGPFAFADAGRLRAILGEAGFTDVTLDDVRETLTLGGSGPLDDAVEFFLQIGPTATVLREADPALRPVVRAAVREVIAPFHGPEGVRMSSASWVVGARRDLVQT
jgi:SAM-dependent methyltransferase